MSDFQQNTKAVYHLFFEITGHILCKLQRIFQKRVTRNQFDIYVFIVITVSILLLVVYWSSSVSSAQYSVLRHWHDLLDIFITEIYSS